MPFNIGDRIFHDRYQVEAVLGHDDAGTIYRAWDLRLGIPVAIHEHPEQDLAGSTGTTQPSQATGAGNSKAFTIPGQGRYQVVDYVAGEDLAALLIRFHYMSGPAKMATREEVAANMLSADRKPDPYQETALIETPNLVLSNDKTRASSSGRWRKPADPGRAALLGLAGVCLLILAFSGIWLLRSLPESNRPERGKSAEAAVLAPSFTLNSPPAATEAPGIPAATSQPLGEAGTTEIGASSPLTGAEPAKTGASAGSAAALPTQGSTASVRTHKPQSPQPGAISRPEDQPSGSAVPGYTLAGRLLPPGAQLIRGVATKGSTTYVLTRAGLLYTYDLSQLDPEGPSQTLETPLNQLQLFNGSGLLRYGDLLYAYGDSGLEILDLSQPGQPVVRHRQKDLEVINLSVEGNRMAALGRSMIVIYDLSRPLQPRVISKLHTPLDVSNFAGAVYKDLLYVSQYWSIPNKAKGLLRVYQLSENKIKEVQRIDAGELAYQLIILDGVLIRCTSSDVEAWDLSRQDIPRFISSVPARARACILDGETVVTYGAAFTLRFGRWQQVSAPGRSGSDNTAGQSFEAYPYGAAVGEGLVFLAQPNQVLVIAGQ